MQERLPIHVVMRLLEDSQVCKRGENLLAARMLVAQIILDW
jgi:hypothetical protein